MQQVLFIPDQLSDHRMWAAIPDRLARRARVSHLDRLITLPWSAGPSSVVEPARGQQPGGWDVAVAAGQAARFAVALGLAGLARGLVLAEPDVPFDRIPEDVDLTLDPPEPDVLEPYQRLVSALHEADREQWRTLVVEVIRGASAADAPPAEVDLAVQIAADHAAEFRAELLAFEAATAAQRKPFDRAQLAAGEARRYWLDQLADLTIPVVTLVSAPRRFAALTIGRIAHDAEMVITDGTILAGAARPSARGQAAAAIEHLLDRLG